MKRYMLPMIIIIGILVGFWYFYDESGAAMRRAKNGYEAASNQVDSAKSQRELSSNQIVALNKSVRESVEFLARWKDYYTANKDYESLLNKAADKSRCAVVGRKWETKKVNVGKLDYEGDTFTGTVVGDYRDIIRFIGELETQLQLSAVWDMQFKDGVDEVACSLTVYFPTLSFGTVGVRQ